MLLKNWALHGKKGIQRGKNLHIFSVSLFVSLEIFPLWQIRLKLTLRTDLLLYEASVLE